MLMLLAAAGLLLDVVIVGFLEKALAFGDAEELFSFLLSVLLLILGDPVEERFVVVALLLFLAGDADDDFLVDVGCCCEGMFILF